MGGEVIHLERPRRTFILEGLQGTVKPCGQHPRAGGQTLPPLHLLLTAYACGRMLYLNLLLPDVGEPITVPALAEVRVLVHVTDR